MDTVEIDKYAADVLDGVQSLLSVAAILAPPGVAQLLAAADLLISYARGHEIRKRKEEKKRGQVRLLPSCLAFPSLAVWLAAPVPLMPAWSSMC